MLRGSLNSRSTFREQGLSSFQSVTKSSPVLSIDEDKPFSWPNTRPGVWERRCVFMQERLGLHERKTCSRPRQKQVHSRPMHKQAVSFQSQDELQENVDVGRLVHVEKSNSARVRKNGSRFVRFLSFFLSLTLLPSPTSAWTKPMPKVACHFGVSVLAAALVRTRLRLSLDENKH